MKVGWVSFAVLVGRGMVLSVVMEVMSGEWKVCERERRRKGRKKKDGVNARAVEGVGLYAHKEKDGRLRVPRKLTRTEPRLGKNKLSLCDERDLTKVLFARDVLRKVEIFLAERSD